MWLTTLESFALTTLLLAVPAQGHGRLSDPAPEFPPGIDITNFIGTINGPKSLPTKAQSQYGWDPRTNTNDYTAAINASPYKSLREFIEKFDHSNECGYTITNTSPKPLPSDGFVKFTHGGDEGFVSSHEGPCEVWCDSTIVFHDDNCAATFKGQNPAKLKIDNSKCQGKAMLRMYWMALHTADWQVYKYCVPLAGGGGGNSAPAPAPGPAPQPNPAPAPEPNPAPAPAPAPGPAPGPAPAPGPYTPPTKHKRRVRRRRRHRPRPAN